MNSIIKAKTTRNGLSFYLNHEGKEYYLFSQRYHTGVRKAFVFGVLLNEALSYSNYNDFCVRKTASKFRSHIKYIEKEYNVKVLDETIKKSQIDKLHKNIKSNCNNLIYSYEY